LKIATEEETEAVLKELEEQKKQKEVEERKLQIEAKLTARLLESEKFNYNKEKSDKLNNEIILNDDNNNESDLNIYKGDIVVVQMEEEDNEDNYVKNLD
jgi:hypothetical protein